MYVKYKYTDLYVMSCVMYIAWMLCICFSHDMFFQKNFVYRDQSIVCLKRCAIVDEMYEKSEEKKIYDV